MKSPQNFYHRLQKGFSFVELLVVVTIIIVLTSVALVSFQSVARNSRNAKRKGDIASVQQAMVLYRSTVGSYPVQTNFTTLVTTSLAGYIANGSSIVDPKNVAPYTYTVQTSTATTFTICANIEPTGTPPYCLSNP